MKKITVMTEVGKQDLLKMPVEASWESKGEGNVLRKGIRRDGTKVPSKIWSLLGKNSTL